MYLDAFKLTLLKLTIAKLVHSTVRSFSADLDALPHTKLTMSPAMLLFFLSHSDTRTWRPSLTIKTHCTVFALLLLCLTYSTMAAFNGSTDALLGDAFFGEFTNGGDFLVGGLPEAVWPLSDGETGVSSGPAASPTSLRKSPSFLLISYSCCSAPGLFVSFSLFLYFYFLL